MGVVRSRTGPRPADADGFTLFEMLLTLALAAGLAALAAPNFGPAIDAARLKSASREVVSALRHARSLALRQRREIRFTMDIHQHVYSLSDRPKIHRLSGDIELKLFTAQSEVIDQGKGSVLFFPDGSSTGGRVTLIAGQRKRLIDINWLTGLVTLTDEDAG